MNTPEKEIGWVILPPIVLPKEPVSIRYIPWSCGETSLVVAEIAYRGSILSIQEDLVCFLAREPNEIRDILVAIFSEHGYAKKGNLLIPLKGSGQALFHANFKKKLNRDAIDELAKQFISMTAS